MIWGQFPGGYLDKQFLNINNFRSQPSTGIPPATRLFPSRCVSMSCMAPSSSSWELKVELRKNHGKSHMYFSGFFINATGFNDVFVYTVYVYIRIYYIMYVQLIFR